MLRFILWRLASAVPTLFVVVTLSFFLIRFAPGGPFNLERPLPAQIMENHQTGKSTALLWGPYKFKTVITESEFTPQALARSN